MKNFRIVNHEEKDIMKRMLSKYLVELSKFEANVKFDENGVPVYKWFNNYWTDYGRYPFFLIIDNVIAGFAMIRFHENEEYDYSIAEFYVLPDFRGNGNAIWFADSLLKLFNGKFKIETRLTNPAGIKFWTKFTLTKNIEKVYDYDNWRYWLVGKENSKI